MDALYDPAPQSGAERILLVMLPGVRDRPEDFIQQGFVRALRERGLPVDVAAVDAHMDYYLERKVIDRLHTDVLAPAREKYQRIWLLGISLGGMGSLLYAREHPGRIEGIILLAPYLGTRGTIADVTRDGGLARWRPGSIGEEDDERRLLAWLKEYRADDPSLPAIYLGYGTSDRFAPASALLAAQLPGGHVVTAEGGHDWPTWSTLWRDILDLQPFQMSPRVEPRKQVNAS